MGTQRPPKSRINGVATEYSYDPGGNVIGREGGAGNRSLEYLPGNRLLRSAGRVYDRDANGNVSRIIEGYVDLRRLLECVGPTR